MLAGSMDMSRACLAFHQLAARGLGSLWIISRMACSVCDQHFKDSRYKKDERDGKICPHNSKKLSLSIHAENLKRNQGSKDSIGMYVVLCYRCKKWREIPTKQEFEAIRERGEEDPWFCGRDPGAGRSCEQPEDIPYDSSRIWAMDRPGIPRPPPETERVLIMRGDLSKMDTYYLMPNGKRARSVTDVERFLKENPGYRATLPASRFSFATPKIVRETVEECSQWRAVKADQRGISEKSSLSWAAMADQTERPEESSLWGDARSRTESEKSETDASDSDYCCPSSSGGSD